MLPAGSHALPHSSPSLSASWARPFLGARSFLLPRRGVLAFGRRPKSSHTHVEELGSSSAEQDSHPAAPPGAMPPAVLGRRGHHLPLRDDRYELPSPRGTSGTDDLVLQQRQAKAAAVQQPGPAAGGAPRGMAAGGGSMQRLQQQQEQLEDEEDGEEYYSEEGSFDEEDGEEEGKGGRPPHPTELVFKLERRGEGWGEELFPHITVEKRPIPMTKSKHKCQHPDPWEEGSLELYLIEVGVPPGDVDRVVEQAVAWRFTPGGRALIDRRRRSRVERNVRLVVQHLEMEGGIPFGPKGIGAILARVPEIMLCKPTTNDRWDRRAVELVAFQHQHGHCNVPEEWPSNPELGAWVKRQRVARAAGQLSDDRMAILQGLGFEFGEVAQMTDEWEHRFDQLIDWMLWHKENQQRFSWLGIDWGYRGGITARELALWVRLQGEFRRRNLLPAEAIKRFEAIGVDWDSEDGTPAEREWMGHFSRLLYVIERHNTVTRPYLLQTARLGRPKAGAATVGGAAGSGAAGPSSSLDEEDDGSSEDEVGFHKSSSAAHRGRAKMQQELAARRRALAVADLRCEAGLRYWLERQRWLWRQGRLPTEQVLMLQLAGVDMERYTSAQWQAEAHAAAALLQRSEVTLTPPPLQAPPSAAPPAGAAVAQQQQGPGEMRGGRTLARGAYQQQGSGWVPQGQQPSHYHSQQQQQLAPGGAAFRGSRGPAQAERGASPGPSPSLRPNSSSSSISSSSNSSQADPAAGRPEAPALGCQRLRVRRWVQTQAALFHEGHLSPAQLRYLAFLGITWVVSDEVMHMGEAAWRARFDQLVALCKRAAADGVPPAAAAVVADRDLREWVRHQRGLYALGLLREDRRKLLGALGLGWGHPRGEEDRVWDARLSELLAFKAEHGHLDVPLSAGPGGAWGPQSPCYYPALGAWVAHQRKLLAVEGALDPTRAAQLTAIGLTPWPVGRVDAPAAGLAQHQHYLQQ